MISRQTNTNTEEEKTRMQTMARVTKKKKRTQIPTRQITTAMIAATTTTMLTEKICLNLRNYNYTQCLFSNGGD